jgi:uncharacterized membrane protein
MSNLPTPAPNDLSFAQPASGDAVVGTEVLFGVSFDDPYRAQEFLLALNRLAAHGALVLRDAVVVTKTAEGHVGVRETTDLQPATAAMRGAMWSGLLGLLIAGPIGWLAGLGLGAGAGALSARMIDTGIPDEWVEWFKAAVQPHTATIIAMADDVDLEPLYAEVRRFEGAELVHTTMQPGVSSKLAEALRATSDTDHENNPE